ncbi:MAG: GC-type dockerin domain-anchored protein [Phycisphaerales bacterium]
MRSTEVLVAAFVAWAGLAGEALAQQYNDGVGREWRQVNTTTGLSWSQVAGVCPADGTGPCAGAVGGRDLTGWYWASQAEVQELFAQFAPELADLECVGGPAFVLPGLYMLGGGVLNPTWSYYTTFGGYLYVSGWTRTLGSGTTAIVASASAQYPVFDGSLCVSGQAEVSAVPQFNGVWLWRPVACAAPTVTLQPTDEVTCGRGGLARFTVEAAATGNATFQWKRNGIPISTEVNPSASSPELVLVGPTESAEYDCVVTDRCGSVTTEVVSLVVCRADVDCNDGVDGDDVIAFFAAWDSGEPDADFTGDGGVDGDDVIAFFGAWDSGC